MNKRQKLVQQQFLNNEKGVIKRLDQTYNKALGDINDKIKNLSFTIGKLQQEYDWMDDNDPEKVKVKSMIQSKIYQKQYQEQLRSQIDGILNQMQTSQFVSVSDYLDTCYTDGFVGTIFDAHGQGIPIVAPINQEAMVRAVQLESKISKGLYTRLGEDVNLLKKKITAQVSRGIATGMSYAQVATQIKNQSRVGYNKAIRIARTEGHRIQTTATMDAMEAAKEKGADVLKQWDSTLDGRTRESHAQVDGEIREMNKPFSNGLMYPGDPSGGAAEVVNCRCALLQRARWALDEDELEELKKRAEYFGLDKSSEFGDFKKKYLKGAEQAPFIDNPFVMIDDPPPMMREFKNVEDYRKAMNDYAEKHPNIDPREFYVEDSNWYGVKDEAELAKVKRFDSTTRKLQEEFPLAPGGEKLTVGTTEGVEHKLTDVQRSRLGDTIEGQRWLNSDTNTTIIAFEPSHSSGTMLDDLTKRNKKLKNGEILDNVFDNSPEGAAIHEWGHSMSEYLTSGMIQDDPNSMEYWDWYKSLSKDDIQKGLSKYATKNRDEFEAECFAELLTGNPRPIAQKYGEYLEKASGGKINFQKPLTNSVKHVKIDMQFFAESDIKKQESASLKRAIRKYEARIADHQQKIDNPMGYVEGWADKDPREQKGLIKHWQKEVKNFQTSIDDRIAELKVRGDYDE